jgi:3-mercaptopyruvate sulfurtransferase SseA
LVYDAIKRSEDLNPINHWQQILPMEAKKLISNKNVQFVDVREVEEYEAGHIPNSTHIPLSQLANRFRELDKTKELVDTGLENNDWKGTCKDEV